MNLIPINTTTALIKEGRTQQVEITTKRRFTKVGNIYLPIDCEPQDANSGLHNGYRFEVLDHDLLLGFAPNERRLPFIRMASQDDISKMVVLWLRGLGGYIEKKGLTPKLIDRIQNGVVWQLDDVSEMRLEVAGHLIRKFIVLHKRPEWNRLVFRVAKAGGLGFDFTDEGTLCNVQIDNKNRLVAFTHPHAWYITGNDLQINPIQLNTRIEPVNNNIFDLIIELNPDDLDKAQYPVYLDPTMTLQPGPTEGYDASYYCDYSTYNMGAFEYLIIYNYVYPTPYGRGYFIKFNLSGIPSGSNIIDAKLYVYTYEGSGNYNMQVKCNRLLRDWGEGNKGFAEASDGECSGKWWRRPSEWSSLGANTIGSDIAEMTDGVQNLDCRNVRGYEQFLNVTETIRACFNAGANYGFRVSAYVHEGLKWLWVYSSDHSTNPSYRPKLVVTYEVGGGAFIPAKLGALAGKGTLDALATAG